MSQYEQFAERGEVQDFYTRGMAEFDKIILGEEDAKTATLLAIAQGSNVATFGVPGGGKTELNESSHLIIDGIEEEGVVQVPNQADLKPEQLIGGHVEIEKKTNGSQEVVSTYLKPLIHPKTQKLEADEVSRTNPHAVGTMLELVRKRRMATTAGELVLGKLLYVGVTLNPSESRQNTFVIADAFASRFPHGAVMGVGDRSVTEKIMGGFVPRPEEVKSIASLDDLQRIRNFLDSTKVSFGEKEQEYGVALVGQMVGRLASDFNYHESESRLARQLRETAHVLAAFHGQEAVGVREVSEAAKFIYTARLGLSGLRGSGLNVNEIHNETRWLMA